MNSLDINPSRDRKQVLAAVLRWLYSVANEPLEGTKATLWRGSLSDVRDGLRDATDNVDVLPSTDEATEEALGRARSEFRRRGYKVIIQKNGRVSIRTRNEAARKPRVAPAPLSVRDAARQVGRDKLKTHPRMWQTASKWGGR